MPNSMNVNPGLLADAAARADAGSQSVFARHSAADGVVDAAIGGWVGASRAALADLAGGWSRSTTELSLRIYRHGEALRVSALTFAEMDAAHARELSAIGPR